MDTFIIRLIEANDTAVTELLQQFRKSYNINTTDFVRFIDTLNDNHQIYVIIDKLNNIIGTGTLLIEHKIIHNLGKVGHIEDIVIDEKYRHQQPGTRLIGFLKQKAMEHGCYKAILNCKEEAIGFYEKNGFYNTNIQMACYF